MPLKVLIVGAGIAGNATAFWFAKLGHDTTVIERFPGLRTNGLQLDLRGHGITLMRHMGLESAVRAKCVPEEGVSLVDHTGKQHAYFAANRSGKGAQSMTSEFEIMRGDLCTILHDAAVEHGAKYIFDNSVESINGQVKLSNGISGHYDLIVGCDGQGSRMRRLMFPDKDSLITLHERAAYFTVPRPLKQGERYIATACAFPGKFLILTRRHKPDLIQMYLLADTTNAETAKAMQDVKRGDVMAEKEAFASMFEGKGWEANNAVKELREGAEDFYCQCAGVVKMEKWHKDNTVLVGDAGYGTPPDGHGTSMALVGAYVLAGELQKAFFSNPTTEVGVKAALEAYQSALETPIRHHEKGYSPEPSLMSKILPSNSFTIGMVLRLAGLVSWLKLDRLLFKLHAFEGDGGWKLPEYKGLLDLVKGEKS